MAIHIAGVLAFLRITILGEASVTLRHVASWIAAMATGRVCPNEAPNRSGFKRARQFLHTTSQ